VDLDGIEDSTSPRTAASSVTRAAGSKDASSSTRPSTSASTNSTRADRGRDRDSSTTPVTMIEMTPLHHRALDPLVLLEQIVAQSSDSDFPLSADMMQRLLDGFDKVQRKQCKQALCRIRVG
ncbi:unnamed protein product, partial [Amoebophrya sp. A25]